MGGIPTIKNGWFMALLYQHYSESRVNPWSSGVCLDDDLDVAPRESTEEVRCGMRHRGSEGKPWGSIGGPTGYTFFMDFNGIFLGDPEIQETSRQIPWKIFGTSNEKPKDKPWSLQIGSFSHDLVQSAFHGSFDGSFTGFMIFEIFDTCHFHPTSPIKHTSATEKFSASKAMEADVVSGNSNGTSKRHLRRFSRISWISRWRLGRQFHICPEGNLCVHIYNYIYI